MSERTETEIKKMTREEAYLTGYGDCKSDILSVIKDIKTEMERVSPVLIDDELWKYLYKKDSFIEIIDKHMLKISEASLDGGEKEL